jgi:hypothetical protein
MASSTPTPTDTESAITPRLDTLATIVEQSAALDELIGLARHSIRVFDVDFSTMRWNDALRSDMLARFLRRSRYAKLDIVVHDTRHIESRCARLLGLQRIFGEQVTIHRSGPDARAAMDPLVLVDDIHFLHRFHADQPRAALGIGQPQEAKSLVQRFNEIWANSEPGVTGTTLGL